MGEVGAALERHPRNTFFEWQSPKGPYRSLTAEQAEQFDRDGYVVIENVRIASTTSWFPVA